MKRLGDTVTLTKIIDRCDERNFYYTVDNKALSGTSMI